MAIAPRPRWQVSDSANGKAAVLLQTSSSSPTTSNPESPEVSSEELLRVTDEILGGAGIGHRFVSVEDDALVQAVRGDLIAAGYEHETTVHMIHTGSAGNDIATRADLYIDLATGIAQFESLVTHPDARGQGYAGAVVRKALHRANDAGCDLAFLDADHDDWPRAWYARLGYVDARRTHHFTRSSS